MLDFESQIKPYLIGATKKDFPKELVHPYYNLSKKVKQNIAETFADEYPSFLDKNRPKERKEFKSYRKDIFKNLVLPFRTKVRNQFLSIRNAEDFYIQFKSEENLDEKRTLEYYCENLFGLHKSVQNWIWNEWLKLFLEDPNSVGVILPVEKASQNEYRDARGLFLPCDNVIYFAQGQFAVLLSLETSTYTDATGKKKTDGKILYFFDNESYTIATQISEFREGGSYLAQFSLLGIDPLVNEVGETGYYFNFPLHGSTEFPVFNVGMTVKESKAFGKFNLYDSIIADAIPHLQTAMQRANDKEISAIHHTALREWQYTQKKCGCGDGTVKKEVLDSDGNFVSFVNETCPKCGGSGYTAFVDSLEIMLVTPPKPVGFDDDKVAVMPTPPGGYIEGSIEPLKAFREEFEYEIRDAYKALGMEHLNESPIVQSGISKKYDRGELSQLLTNVSRFLKEEIFDTVFECIDSIRYGFSGKSGQQLPVVSTPKRFDLSTEEITRLELEQAINKGFDSSIIDSKTLKYIEQATGKESEFYKKYELRMKIDPYRSLTNEDKSFEIANLFVTADRESEQFNHQLRKLYFSKNFEACLQEALITNADFWAKEVKDQKAILESINDQLFSVLNKDKEVIALALRPTVDIKNNNQNGIN